MNNLNFHKRKYVKFATIPTEQGDAVAAFLVIEVGGEVVFVSAPKIVRYVKNETLLLEGEVSSALLLPGNVQKTVFVEATPSPYLEYFNATGEEFSVYSPRAPTSQ